MATWGMTLPDSIDFHFDPMCPFAFQTSIWIRNVRELNGLDINWRFFSLEEVNREEGKKHPWEREWSYGWSIMRIGALLRRRDMAELDAWYLRVGSALHLEGHKAHRPEVARHLLEEIGLDPELADQAIDDPTTHDDVLADHRRVVEAGGFGVPTIFSGDDCIFGPVLIDPPTGDAAVRLWENVATWFEYPLLFEIQRPKNAGHVAAITESFRPYLEARDWVSIDRGRVIEFPDDPARSRR